MSRSDINIMIMGLKEETGLPVEADPYKGDKTSYMVYSWVNSYGEYFGDDTPLYDLHRVNVVLYTPLDFNPSKLITKIRDYLENKGFRVIIWGPNPAPLGDSSKSEYNSQTVFETEYRDYH